MLRQSTVSICREFLTYEVKACRTMEESLSIQLRNLARLPSTRTLADEERYCAVFNRRQAWRVRRKKVEAAIRDLKANMEGKQCYTIDIESWPLPSSLEPLAPWPWDRIATAETVLPQK